MRNPAVIIAAIGLIISHTTTRGVETLGSSSLEPTAQETAAKPEQQVFDCKEGSSLRSVLRMLAKAGGINYVEPEIDPKETISCTIRGMSARDAFYVIARQRGFSIQEQGDGVVTLNRQGIAVRGQLVTRRYVLRHVDVRLVIASVANSLGIPLTVPAATSPAFPPPAITSDLTSVGSQTNTTSTMTGGNGYTGQNTQTGGGNPKGRWVPSLPMDTPLSKGGYDSNLPTAVYQDRAANAIVVRAPEAQQTEISAYIATLDQAEDQVEIETRIVEIDTDRARDLGLEWSFKASDPFRTGSATFDGGIAAQLGYGSPGTILSASQVSAKLTALEKKGLTTTVSWTRSITRSGVPVTITNATEQQIELSSVAAVGQVTTGQTQTQSYITGVMGDVTPVLLGDGAVDLNINPTVATQVGTTKGASGQLIPKISRRNITTSVVVPNGLTVAIGGVMQVGSTQDHQEVPFLGKIPGVGLLFKKQGRSKMRSTLVILVTPRIIQGGKFNPPLMTEEDSEIMAASDQPYQPAPTPVCMPVQAQTKVSR